MITFDDMCDARADLLDNSGAFVAKHGRRGPSERTRSSGHVAMTNAGSHHFDDDLASAGIADFKSVEYFSFVASENDALHEFPQS